MKTVAVINLSIFVILALSARVYGYAHPSPTPKKTSKAPPTMPLATPSYPLMTNPVPLPTEYDYLPDESKDPLNL